MAEHDVAAAVTVEVVGGVLNDRSGLKRQLNAAARCGADDKGANYRRRQIKIGAR